MKKKILIIIAFIMIISTIIRTFIVGASFLNYSNSLIKNQTNLIVDILREVIDKDKFLHIIQNSHPIKKIEFIKGQKNELIYSFKDKTIISIVPFNELESLKIVFSAKNYFDKLLMAIAQLILIALISLIIIILLVNHFLKPYLEILEKIEESTNNILKGNFNNKIELKLKGEAKDFVNSYNYFLQKLKESFGVIEEKYTALIEKEKSNDPLNDAKETIEQLANIFKFKRIIEEDNSYETILERLVDIIKEFEIKHFIIIGIENNENIAKIIHSQGDICCNVLENYKDCRAYRLKKEINSLKMKKECLSHYCNTNHICLPFSSTGNFTGILKIIFTDEEKKHVLKVLPYIKAYLNEISTIIESKYTLELLHNQNIKDPLTRLYNRRYLENMLPTLIEGAKRRNGKIGFIMLDMDHFKQVNDTYGHDAGDRVLEKLSEIILENIRKSDIPVRLGGEEFLIIATNIKTKEDLRKIADKIRLAVKSQPFYLSSGLYINKTISIGAALFPDDCEDGNECIKLADKALYEAKNQGRDKIVIN
ncbi:GGDEF domain-containing protein [Caminibacter pacificus]|uniref:diguanylate cyclase n=1 Tax=Caminibacter pacificus TaxID=1424653 RepID=A0AAJ4UXL4_9BACT|nr:GGDEF domain-containing protein [Caminibacter pacificus]QCI28774.1 GGDEF domain-containing protein [Caminibacter pacificus]ROR39362.1 diguanylate cyclase (GGDEF)-like protein [Caminibacter pacificus]